MSLSAKAKLLYWLGPWSKVAQPTTSKIETTTVNLCATRPPMRLRLFFPSGKISGAVYLLAGLHFEGADHPEIQRFIRILNQVGVLVAAPDIEDYLALNFDPRSIDDAVAGFRVFAEHEQVRRFRPCVLSISLGSRLALGVCAKEAKRVGSLITFGGYQDWKRALYFCLSGEGERKHDPLNRPIVFTALQSQLPDLPEKSQIIQAWRNFAEATWGKDELKNHTAMARVSQEFGNEFEGAALELFHQGLGLAPGGDELIRQCLTQPTKLDWLNIENDLDALDCPLLALHARHDDVIACEQSQWLVGQAPKQTKAQAILTGMYSHSGRKIPRPSEIAGELRGLFAIASRLVYFTSLPANA